MNMTERASQEEQTRRGRGHALADKYLIPVMMATVAIFLSVALVIVVRSTLPMFDPLTYSPQTIERITDDGIIIVPNVAGFDPPSIQIDGRVPVRGTLTNSADHRVSVSGSVVWQEEPPGQRFTTQANVPGTIAEGITQLQFENPVPPEVRKYVLENGPTSFSINGRVEVLEAGGVDATWETATFMLVP